jgi:hypothetical protein
MHRDVGSPVLAVSVNSPIFGMFTDFSCCSDCSELDNFGYFRLLIVG